MYFCAWKPVNASYRPNTNGLLKIIAQYTFYWLVSSSENKFAIKYNEWCILNDESTFQIIKECFIHIVAVRIKLVFYRMTHGSYSS